MTRKLYDIDPYRASFSARVVSCQQGKTGWEVALDQTAFYPEGGGQPGDWGKLNDILVTGAHERAGEIFHLCAQPLPVGQTVTGEIDWPRRFDHMQQHSGEHIVSGMICARYRCDNVGFHLGKETVTIDFNHPIPPEDLPVIQQAANAYLWEDHPVDIALLDGEALQQAVYRSKKEIPGAVRLVAFPGADRCACCGTHVRSSGQVGLVTLLSCQRFREGVRIELLCGKRAMDYLAGVEAQNAAVSRLLSAKPLETREAVNRLQQELESQKLRAAALEEEKLDRIARSLAGAEQALVLAEGLSPDGVRRLCDKGMAACNLCAVFSPNQEGFQYAIGAKDADLRALAKALNDAFSGRGGGKAGFVQGRVSAQWGPIREFFAQRFPNLREG